MILREHHAVLPVLNQHIRAAVRRGQRHRFKEHGFQKHHAENFIFGRQQEEIRLMIRGSKLLLSGLPLPDHVLRQPHGLDLLCKGRGLHVVAIANDIQLCHRAPLMKLLH